MALKFIPCYPVPPKWDQFIERLIFIVFFVIFLRFLFQEVQRQSAKKKQRKSGFSQDSEMFHVSNEKNPWLFRLYRGDYTTHIINHCKTSPLTNQDDPWKVGGFFSWLM